MVLSGEIAVIISAGVALFLGLINMAFTFFNLRRKEKTEIFQELLLHRIKAHNVVIRAVASMQKEFTANFLNAEVEGIKEVANSGYVRYIERIARENIWIDSEFEEVVGMFTKFIGRQLAQIEEKGFIPERKTREVVCDRCNFLADQIAIFAKKKSGIEFLDKRMHGLSKKIKGPADRNQREGVEND